jgi:hypothetical protein
MRHKYIIHLLLPYVNLIPNTSISGKNKSIIFMAKRKIPIPMIQNTATAEKNMNLKNVSMFLITNLYYW